MKIVVLAGGTSTERDVSIVSGTGICGALRQKGHQAILVDIFCGIENVDRENPFPSEYDVDAASEYMSAFNDRIEQMKKERRSFFGPNVLKLCEAADIVFLGLHGANGEDGKLQGAFDLTDVFAYPPVKKSTENPPYALKKTTCSIIIKGGKGLNTNDEKIQWHPAFDAALQIEFGDEAKYLEFDPEHLISKKPMQIDVLVKNEKHVKLRKNIGRIFRQYNIIEYKSPEDDLDIDDFYKTYAYACLYKSDTETVDLIPADELTITFVCYHYPRNMLRKLEQDRKFSVEQQDSGIYYLIGDAIPIQLVIVPKLSKEHNYWLNNLRNRN